MRPPAAMAAGQPRTLAIVKVRCQGTLAKKKFDTRKGRVMTSPIAANWLAIIGLVYAGIGVVLIATAQVSSMMLAGCQREARRRQSRNQGACAAFGALLVVIGFAMQAIGHVITLAAGPVVAGLLVGLMVLLAVFALCDFSEASETADGGVMVADAPVAAAAARAASIADDPPVKLVSAAAG